MDKIIKTIKKKDDDKNLKRQKEEKGEKEDHQIEKKLKKSEIDDEIKEEEKLNNFEKLELIIKKLEKRVNKIEEENNEYKEKINKIEEENNEYKEKINTNEGKIKSLEENVGKLLISKKCEIIIKHFKNYYFKKMRDNLNDTEIMTKNPPPGPLKDKIAIFHRIFMDKFQFDFQEFYAIIQALKISGFSSDKTIKIPENYILNSIQENMKQFKFTASNEKINSCFNYFLNEYKYSL